MQRRGVTQQKGPNNRGRDSEPTRRVSKAITQVAAYIPATQRQRRNDEFRPRRGGERHQCPCLPRHVAAKHRGQQKECGNGCDVAVESTGFELPGRGQPGQTQRRGRHGRHVLTDGVDNDENEGADFERMHQPLDHENRFPADLQREAMERRQQQREQGQMRVRVGLIGERRVVVEVRRGKRDFRKLEEVLQVGVQERLGLEHTRDERQRQTSGRQEHRNDTRVGCVPDLLHY